MKHCLIWNFIYNLLASCSKMLEVVQMIASSITMEHVVSVVPVSELW